MTLEGLTNKLTCPAGVASDEPQKAYLPAGSGAANGSAGLTVARPYYLASNGTCFTSLGSIGVGFVGKCFVKKALTSSNALYATAGRGVAL